VHIFKAENKPGENLAWSRQNETAVNCLNDLSVDA
jgi:hypothetical protein